MIRRTPSGASEMSLMSKCRVAAIAPPVERTSLRGQEPLVLALFPVDPSTGVARGGATALDSAPELGFPSEAGGERQLVDAEPEAPPQLRERAQLVQLAEAVGSVARRRSPWHEKTLALEVAQHPRRPAALPRCLADRQRRHRRQP